MSYSNIVHDIQYSDHYCACKQSKVLERETVVVLQRKCRLYYLVKV